MGARSGYTLLTGLLVGIGGMLGLVAGLVQWLPLAVLAPIIVYVGMGISVQAFRATPERHAPAVALAFLPSLAYLLAIKLGNPAWVAPERFAALYAETGAHGLPELAVLVTLGNGFIITAMLWATLLVAMIEGRMRLAAAVLVLCAVLTAFGVIHSVDPRGGVYLPWTLEGLRAVIAGQFAGAYGVLALLLAALSWQRPRAGAPV